MAKYVKKQNKTQKPKQEEVVLLLGLLAQDNRQAGSPFHPASPIGKQVLLLLWQMEVKRPRAAELSITGTSRQLYPQHFTYPLLPTQLLGRSLPV